ncbi:MAG TPA: nucleic acid-binding protein [Methanocorpusculum sp.]|nr:nucleic acid-binding protein [Methanocorpusculum sp.]
MVDAGQRYEREPAKRVFASELRESIRVIKGSSDEKSPAYILLPTGERCNRIIFSGTLTDKSKSAGDQNVQYRARVSDPTGVFYINASTYQPEAMAQMAKIDSETPAFVIVIGKPNLYTNNEGKTLVSIRVESIQVVDREIRDIWVLDTARATLKRINNMFVEGDKEQSDIALARETYNQSEGYWRKVVYNALASLI